MAKTGDVHLRTVVLNAGFKFALIHTQDFSDSQQLDICIFQVLMLSSESNIAAPLIECNSS